MEDIYRRRFPSALFYHYLTMFRHFAWLRWYRGVGSYSIVISSAEEASPFISRCAACWPSRGGHLRRVFFFWWLFIAFADCGGRGLQCYCLRSVFTFLRGIQTFSLLLPRLQMAV